MNVHDQINGAATATVHANIQKLRSGAQELPIMASSMDVPTAGQMARSWMERGIFFDVISQQA
jgi:hypothetical protein